MTTKQRAKSRPVDGLVRLNLGAGRERLPGWLAVDKILGSDICLDLDNVPWPFGDGSVDAVRASHVLEHLRDPAAAVREIARILKPGARCTILVPHAQGIGAYRTGHLHRFSVLAVRDLMLGWNGCVRLHFIFAGDPKARFFRWADSIMSIWPELWEKIGILPPDEIAFVGVPNNRISKQDH